MREIPQMRPWFDEKEKQALCDYMDEGGFLTEFKKTLELEAAIASYVGSKHCILVNNGTVSLTLAALAAGLKAGDEVLVPNYTMIASPNSVKLFGANPVFVDVEPETLCMDVALARAAITKNTRAIMIVSANGRFPKSGIRSFIELAEEFNLVLIEDAAQALGSRFPGGNHIGTVGRVGSFSLSAPKIISTGQGGAVVTDDDDLAKRVRKLKDFGRSGGGNDIHDSIGYNFKFTELQAVVGLAQMSKLSWRVSRKREIWKEYQSHLASVREIRLFDHDLQLTAPWFIDCIAERRDELVIYLKSKGIGTRVMYPPINRQAAYSLPGSYPVSEHVGAHGLWLPSFAQLLDEEIEWICFEIQNFYKQ